MRALLPNPGIKTHKTNECDSIGLHCCEMTSCFVSPLQNWHVMSVHIRKQLTIKRAVLYYVHFLLLWNRNWWYTYAVKQHWRVEVAYKLTAPHTQATVYMSTNIHRPWSQSSAFQAVGKTSWKANELAKQAALKRRTEDVRWKRKQVSRLSSAGAEIIIIIIVFVEETCHWLTRSCKNLYL